MFDLQAWLDEVVECFLAKDEDRYTRMMALPFSVITSDRTLIADREEDIRDAFRSYVATMKAQGVTDLVRVAIQTTMIEPTLATGIYETHVLRRGHRIIDPYLSAVTLRRSDDVWRATSMVNAVAHNDWTARMPASGQDPKDD